MTLHELYKIELFILFICLKPNQISEMILAGEEFVTALSFILR